MESNVITNYILTRSSFCDGTFVKGGILCSVQWKSTFCEIAVETVWKPLQCTTECLFFIPQRWGKGKSSCWSWCSLHHTCTVHLALTGFVPGWSRHDWDAVGPGFVPSPAKSGPIYQARSLETLPAFSLSRWVVNYSCSNSSPQMCLTLSVITNIIRILISEGSCARSSDKDEGRTVCYHRHNIHSLS